jgi:hypothetical protein
MALLHHVIEIGNGGWTAATLSLALRLSVRSAVGESGQRRFGISGRVRQRVIRLNISGKARSLRRFQPSDAAASSTDLPEGEEWQFELKFDGVVSKDS